MRSAVHTVYGDPAEVLHLADMPKPEPGPKQVRVRTVLAAIHNHDLWTVRGGYGYKPPLPAIAGSEAVGIVDALGEGVDEKLLGKRVASASVRGAWAEYFVAPAAGLLPVPDAINDEAAAQLIAMPFSAIMLLDYLNVQPGDWIAQNTANGAVGKMVAALAQSRGVNAINLVRRDEGVAELSALGIANAVSTAEPGWKKKVRALVGEAPLKAGVDSIGGTATQDMAEILSENGLLVSFGSMTGEPMQVSSGTMIFKQLTLKGFWLTPISAAMAPEKRQGLMGELLKHVIGGTLKLSTEAIIDLADIKQAVSRSLTPGRTGKVLLRP
ncbi:MAG: zinc-binding dehydrogenase [Rhodospirillaceae bacterium]|nr:zinc-binding dehydrogenase [Rhodospirillaceae bacterium]